MTGDRRLAGYGHFRRSGRPIGFVLPLDLVEERCLGAGVVVEVRIVGRGWLPPVVHRLVDAATRRAGTKTTGGGAPAPLSPRLGFIGPSMANYPALDSIRPRIRSDAVRSCRSSAG